MSKTILAIVLSCLPIVAFSATENYTVDPLHTFPNFTINHLGFSTMHGRFGKTSGKLTMDEAGKTGSVEVVIDAASVDTGYGKRNDHLRSPDFLNANEFPDITYKSTKVMINGDKATVEGNLTIKGVTKPVTLDVNRIHCGNNPMKKEEYRCGFDATADIKRSDFDVTFALPAIGDDMHLMFEVEAIKD